MLIQEWLKWLTANNGILYDKIISIINVTSRDSGLGKFIKQRKKSYVE